MRHFSNLGMFLIHSALVGAISNNRRVVTMTMADLDVCLSPRTLSDEEASAYLKSQTKQADVDALDRAEAKRERKAAKLRERGL